MPSWMKVAFPLATCPPNVTAEPREYQMPAIALRITFLPFKWEGKERGGAAFLSSLIYVREEIPTSRHLPAHRGLKLTVQPVFEKVTSKRIGDTMTGIGWFDPFPGT